MISNLAELDRVRQDCRRLVTKRSLTAAGAAIVPVPGADILADLRFCVDHAKAFK